MQFVVKYSQKLDINNYHHAFHSSFSKLYGQSQDRFRKYLNPGLIDKITKSKSVSSTAKIVKKHWLTYHDSLWNQHLKFTLIWFQKILNADQNLIVKPLEKLYQHSFPFKKITVYLTCFPRCPYNYQKRWYMVTKNSSLTDLYRTSLHELNHFMFYYYYQDKLKDQITNDQFEIIKEALAILTNPEGNNKPAVKPLEDHIKTINTQPIDAIIKSAVNFINHGHS